MGEQETKEIIAILRKIEENQRKIENYQRNNLKFDVACYKIIKAIEGKIKDNNKPERLLASAKELSEMLGVSEEHARQLMRSRNGFGVQIGKQWKCNIQKVKEWSDKRSR